MPPDAGADAEAILQPRIAGIVCAIGIAQIISWGSLVYAIAVLGYRMQADLGISRTALFTAFTLSLLISGMAAPLTGRLIDERGGRQVMAVGSVIAAAALFIMSLASGFLALLAGAVVAGVAMSAVLYDASFSTLHQVTGTAYRKAVTIVTFFGGFASTIFWPLSQAMLDAAGWRTAFLVYAALQLCICLPLHLFLVPRPATFAPLARGEAPPMPQPAKARDPRWLSAAFALSAFALSAVSIHLIGLFQHAGMTPAEAVTVAALMGPTQVLGRVIELVFARRLRPVAVGAIAIGLLAAALLALLFVDGLSVMAIAFTMFFGLSNGIMTIARGTVPLELFGSESYGRLLGSIARPAFIARALAPMLFAFGMSSSLGSEGATLILLACAILSLAAYYRAVRMATLPQARKGW